MDGTRKGPRLPLREAFFFPGGSELSGAAPIFF